MSENTLNDALLARPKLTMTLAQLPNWIELTIQTIEDPAFNYTPSEIANALRNMLKTLAETPQALAEQPAGDAHYVAEGRGYWQIAVEGKPYNFRNPPGFKLVPDTTPPAASLDVEAKARELFTEQADRLAAPWEQQWEPTREYWRKQARAALVDSAGGAKCKASGGTAECKLRDGGTLCQWCGGDVLDSPQPGGEAKGEKPFKAPGEWFPLTVMGQPMREFAPGRWEHASWPSDTPQPDGGDRAVHQWRDAYGGWRDCDAKGLAAYVDCDTRVLYTRPSAAAAVPAAGGKVVAWLCSNEFPHRTVATASEGAMEAYRTLGRRIEPLVRQSEAPAAPKGGVVDEGSREAVDREVRQARAFYFRHNPANTLLANAFNEILRANGTFESDLVANQRRQEAALATPRAEQDFPECSGNPASCPENEGYGCCKPNPAASPENNDA